MVSLAEQAESMNTPDESLSISETLDRSVDAAMQITQQSSGTTPVVDISPQEDLLAPDTRTTSGPALAHERGNSPDTENETGAELLGDQASTKQAAGSASLTTEFTPPAANTIERPGELRDGQRRRRKTAAVTVVDWTTTGIIIGLVQGSGVTAELKNSAFQPWPAGFDPFADPEQTGFLLKEMLKNAPWAGKPAAISIPRQLVSLRLLQLPNVVAEDLPALITLQMEARQSAQENIQTWDFVVHPASKEATTRHVSVVSVPSAVCQSLRQSIAAAGWKATLLTAADLHVGPPEANGDDLRITIQANRSKLEVVAQHAGLPAASIATSAGPDPETVPAAALVLSLVHRVTESLPEAWRANPSRFPLHLCGSRAQALADLLRAEGQLVTTGPVDERGPRALALRDLLLSSRQRLNFFRPGSAPASLLKRYSLAIRLSLIGGALAAALAFVVIDRMQTLQKTLDAGEKRLQFLNEVAQRGEATLNQWTELEKWDQDTLNAAREFQAVLQIMPSHEQMLVTRLQLENMPASDERVLRLEGLAQSADDIRQLNTAVLAQPERYTLRPHGIEPAPIGSPMPISFRMESRILQNAPEASITPVRTTEELPMTAITETEQ